MQIPLRYRISVDSDLLIKEDLAISRAKDTVFDCADLDSADLRRTLDVLIDASTAEQDRETNLNARGAAVATVGGVLVAASSAVAKPVFGTEEWTDWTKVAALISFGAAVFAVASAAVLAVGWVLRPGRGSNTKNFFGETVVNLWLGGHSKELVCADEDRLNLLFADRCLRTLPAWHFRNRRKARWLRRSWMFLAIGIVFIAAAGVFVLARTIEVAAPEADGLAANIQWWQIPAVIAGFAVLSLVSIYRDWLCAGRRDKKWNSDEQKRADAARAAEAAKAAKGAVETSEALEREVREIAEKLPVSPTLSNKQSWV